MATSGVVLWRGLKPSTLLKCLSYFTAKPQEKRASGEADGCEAEAARQRARIQDATDEIQGRL